MAFQVEELILNQEKEKHHYIVNKSDTIDELDVEMIEFYYPYKKGQIVKRLNGKVYQYGKIEDGKCILNKNKNS